MAPRGHTLPQATTESAREARKSFFCELCQKGYARMNDYEAHEGSYDHQHRKRLKEMRSLTRDPNAAAKARAAEQKANEEAGLKSISLPISTASGSEQQPGSVKKKPVFKSTLQPQNADVVQTEAVAKPVSVSADDDGAAGFEDEGGDDYDDDDDPSGAIRNGWYEERYVPWLATGCEDEACKVCKNGVIDVRLLGKGPMAESE